MNLKEIIFDKIKSGVFLVPYCNICIKFMWPPSYYCNICFRKTYLKKVENNGIMLEKSFSNLPFQNNYFGIGNFSNIIILGKMDKEVKIMDRIRISKIEIKDNKLDIKFEKLNVLE